MVCQGVRSQMPRLRSLGVRRWEAGVSVWPFRKKQKASASSIMYSQVNITETFGDDQRLGPEEWIRTVPLNARAADPQSMGLPPAGAPADEVYRIASKLSELRESIPIPNDGVYCPVCHVANVNIDHLRTPCHQCGRPLLKFGWD